jgi:hypothetical protein
LQEGAAINLATVGEEEQIELHVDDLTEIDEQLQ